MQEIQLTPRYTKRFHTTNFNHNKVENSYCKISHRDGIDSSLGLLSARSQTYRSHPRQLKKQKSVSELTHLNYYTTLDTFNMEAVVQVVPPSPHIHGKRFGNIWAGEVFRSLSLPIYVIPGSVTTIASDDKIVPCIETI